MEFNSNQTVLSQIVAFVKRKIFSGRLAPGKKLTPIREFASFLSVNPNTVAKAYAILEEEKLIYTDSTLGKFVCIDREFLKEKRRNYLENEMAIFKKQLEECGVSEEEFLCLAKKK